MHHFSLLSRIYIIVSTHTFLFGLKSVKSEHTVSTDHNKLKISLIHYTHLDDSKDDDDWVCIPEDSEFHSKEEFHDQIVRKFKNLYVASERLNGVTFICEADQPVVWTVTQEIHNYLQPNFIFASGEFRESNCSKSHKNDGLYKTALDASIIAADDADDLMASLIDKRRNHSWNFTCHYKSDKNISETITFQMTNSANNTIQHLPSKDLIPDKKIVVSFLKEISNQDPTHIKDLTTINLDSTFNFFSNSAPVKSQFCVDQNVTEIFDDFTFTNENGFLHIKPEGMAVKSKLKEYEANEAIHVGDSFHVLCFSLQEFYMYGASVKINWENGSKTILEEMKVFLEGIQATLNLETSKPPVYQDIHNGSLIPHFLATELLIYLSKPVVASSDMRSVECFMPKRDHILNQPWEMVSRPLKIHKKAET